MSWGACIHLITREIVLSAISFVNVKEKFGFVYFYCTLAERKFVAKIAALGGLWHFGLMRERIPMILTRREQQVNVCLNPFSTDIRKDFKSLRFSLLMIEYFRCARTSSASFRFSFLSRNDTGRQRKKQASETSTEPPSALSVEIKWKMQERMNRDSHLVTRINGTFGRQEAIAVITCGSRFKLFSSLCFGSGSLFMCHKRSCC